MLWDLAQVYDALGRAEAVHYYRLAIAGDYTTEYIQRRLAALERRFAADRVSER